MLIYYQETFLIIINVETVVLLYNFAETVIFFFQDVLMILNDLN